MATRPSSTFTALLSTVMVLRMGPVCMLYFTSILPVLPGAIGSVGFEGTVQPQLDCTLVMIKGSSPVLVN